VAYSLVGGQEPQQEQWDNGCYLVTACKNVNNSQANARQLLSKWIPMAKDSHKTIKVLVDYNNGKGVFHVVRAKIL
jgi:bacillopeptidase F (M6 metalloprotease family)